MAGGKRAGSEEKVPAPVIAGWQVQQVELTAGAMSSAAASRLAAVTARAAGAPAAMIHIADGEQLGMAGGSGLSAGWEAIRRVPVTSALAGIILAGGEPMIVSDIAGDARVPEDAPIRAMGGRAYAGFPIRDPDNEVVGVCAVMDYQPRQWTQEELAGVDEGAQACTAFVAERRGRQEADRQRRFLDALLDNLQAGVAACDAHGRLVLINEAARQLYHGMPDDADVRQWLTANPIGDPGGGPLATEAAPLLRALAGERLRDVEVTIRRPGERLRVLLTDAQPITDADGHPLGAVVVARDVTDERRAEQFREVEFAVTEVLAHASSVQEAGPQVLRAVCSTLQWPYAELWLVDEQAEALVPIAHYATDHYHIGELSPQIKPGDALTGAAWRTGQPVWIGDINAASGANAVPGVHLRTGLAIPVPSGGRVLAVASFFADVVEHPAQSLLALLSGAAAHIGEFLERRRAEELALALARSKDEYVALVGHELRTPLTSIAAYTDFLREADPDLLAADAPDMLDIIARNNQTVLHIVDELLDLAGLDSGHTVIACEPVDLTAIVQGVADTAEPVATAAGVRLRLDLAAGTNIIGDTHRLRQVARHLLANAINHSPDGGQVTVTLTRPARTVAELTVADTGLGIPADERERLFSRFYRSTRTRERRIPGAGLGLAVSRAIVERHHGSIRLNPGGSPGTSITVRLPTDRCDPQPADSTG